MEQLILFYERLVTIALPLVDSWVLVVLGNAIQRQ